MSGAQAHEFAEPLERIFKSRIDGYESILGVERLSGGASQETYRLTLATEAGRLLLAMRRAPGGGEDIERMGSSPGLDVEARLMQAASAVGVPEPEVVHVLVPEDGLGEGFIMQWLEGEALGARIARAPAYADLRTHLAYDCGRMLAQIHAIDLDETGLRNDLQLTEPAEFIEQTWARYREFPTPQPMIDYTARWLIDHLPDNPAPALVHNDFRNGNIMVDEQGVVAVLDWEIAHIGDPMRDLGWICTNSWRFGKAELPVGGFGLREDLFRGYEDESGVEVDAARVKFWEVFGSFWWAVGCLGMAEHYRNGPDKTVERPGIGRRSSECQVDCANLIIPGPVSLIDESLLHANPPDRTAGFQMPQLDELLLSVRDFLREDVMSETTGRTQFLARVAANSLDIVDREVRMGSRLEQQETEQLRALGLDAPTEDGLTGLRWALVNALRDEDPDKRPSLDDAGLQAYLRETAVNQLAIDQPKYSGLKVALNNNTQA